MKDWLWLIPLFPAISAVVNLLVGRFLPKRAVSLLSCGTVLASFVLSVITFFQLIQITAGPSRVITDNVYNWFSIGTLKINIAFLIDPLSAIMILVVTGVGFIIHVYSVGYMADDKRYARYFGFLNLFVFAMLLLVMGDNLLLLFVGWEGVGLCSYLLIGFWFEKKENAQAGLKAFIVNRIGDFGFTIGIIMLFWTIGNASGVWTISFQDLKEHVNVLTPAAATVIGLLLFAGATGKSAQIPLYFWLPDAMAGPTPVSALIHAATMVTAGVYMVARMNFLFVLTPTAMLVVAIIGVATAVFAGIVGLMQNDIKRVLAYSTVSQLGYMFLGVGVGAFAAAIFHLMTHAFFKALLFLGSGSVIHGTGGEQDMRKMGGLRKFMPITFWTFLIGTLAIVGIPFFSGFFSKDAILWGAYSSGHTVLWAFALGGVGLTGLYMFRLLFMTFFGKNRSGHEAHITPEQETAGTPECCDVPTTPHVKHPHIHESPAIMTIPLIVLAVLAVIGGYVGIPAVLGGGDQIVQFMEPVFGSSGEPVSQSTGGLVDHATGGPELLLMLLSVGVVLVSILLAWFLYLKRTDVTKKIMTGGAWLFNTLIKLFYSYKEGLSLFDRGVVNGSAKGTVEFSNAVGRVDNVVVDGAVNATAQGVLAGGSAVQGTQTGLLKNYLAWVFGGIIVLVMVVLIIKTF